MLSVHQFRASERVERLTICSCAIQGHAERVQEGAVPGVEAARGYTYTMISRSPGNDQTGRVRLEGLGPNRTRLHFEERYNLGSPPWKWFEAPIYRFINKQNERSMQRLSDWLAEHPEYRPDLVEAAPAP